MTKIGVDATFYNMGGCADSFTVCNETIIDGVCDTHRVDIGAHWELAGTVQGVEYSMNDLTGDDEVANKDDEYAVSPYCRLDDDDMNAGNEWSGAWLHTNPVDGELGTYVFEMSRLLTTPSTKTDAQMEAGGTYEIGVAFWDPNESMEGWSDAGHYTTGCAQSWIELELAVSDSAPTSAVVTNGAPTIFIAAFSLFLLAMMNF